MAENSKIGWTDHSFNFWQGCNKVSTECKACYIKGILKRAGKEPFEGPIRTKNWDKPIKWNREAEKRGVRLRVFTCSMSDFFHPGADQWRSDAWKLIRKCKYLDWQILSKRSELISDRLPKDWGAGYSNVWFGVTCGHSSSINQVEQLTKIPAALRFISAEPLLEPIDFRPFLPNIDWVITGCEQAAKKKRRVMKLDWVRDINRQCQAANVPHFFKQYYNAENTGRPIEDGVLDGTVVQDFPESPAKVDEENIFSILGIED